MFQGASQLTLDNKGRLVVPARHRDALQLQSEGHLTLTRHPHGCLLVFPRPRWEALREDIVRWPMSARAWQRIFLGNASDVDMDAAGRVLIAPELRRAGRLDRDVMLVGMGSHFELWDASAHEQAETDTLAGDMPEALADLSF